MKSIHHEEYNSTYPAHASIKDLRDTFRLWAQVHTTSKTMAGDDDHKIQKFHGKSTDDYNLWRIRAEVALKGKGYWANVHRNECPADVKEKAAAMLTQALGDAPFRVCSSKAGNPILMLELLDMRYASTRAASRISVLTSVYSKKYQHTMNMPKYVDEFETLFAQLERMGNDTAVPESHKAPLLLASMGHESELESTVAALRLKETNSLTWEAVTADLIQEWKRVRDSAPQSAINHKNNKGYKRNPTLVNQGCTEVKAIAHKAARASSTDVCGFCGKNGHTTQDCFINPQSPKCKLTDQAKKSLKGLSTNVKAEKNHKKRLHFGQLAVLSRNRRALKAAKRTGKTFLDSGASVSMFRRKREAQEKTYEESYGDTVQLAAGQDEAACIGTGTLILGKMKVQDAVHVKGLNETLVSVGQVCDQDHIVVFTRKNAVILRIDGFDVNEEDVVMIANRDENSGLYILPIGDTASETKGLAVFKTSTEISLWHNRLAHISERSLKELHKHASDVPVITGALPPCHPCKLGKATKKKFSSRFEPANYAGEIVHSDLMGPIPTAMNGTKYVCTFTDQYSRYCHVVGLRSKDEAEQAIQEYKQLAHVTKYFKNGAVERLHTDGGLEFSNADVPEHSTTTPHTPQHNPFSERLNRSLMDPVRVMLEQSGLSAKYWDYCLDYSVYVKNRTVHSSIKCSPYEKLTGKKPTLKHVRTFGCAAFIYEHKPKSKVHAKASPAIMLGCNDHGVYTVELLSTNHIVNSVHVTFDETSFPGLQHSESSSTGEGSDYTPSEDSSSDNDAALSSLTEFAIADADEIDLTNLDHDVTETNDDVSEILEQVSAKEAEQDASQELPRRSGRIRNVPDFLTYEGNETKRHYANTVISVPITTSDDPTVRKAMSSTAQERDLWLKAIQDEFNGLEERGTWKVAGSLRQNFKNANVLPSHIILRIKRNESGHPIRFKARIVVGGNHQVKGRDFDSVYSPVVSFTTVLIVLAMAEQYSWETIQADMTLAFLNGDIDREIYVGHPFNAPASLNRSVYYQLQAALYGLKQAPLQWFLKLRINLVEKFGYSQLISDGAVFTRGCSISLVVILVYVDDMIFVGPSKKCVQAAISEVLNTFKGKNEGQLTWYLGVHVKHNGSSKCLKQEAYIDQLLAEYDLMAVTCYNTPMQANFYADYEANASETVMDADLYRSMIGELLFLSNRSRPDICVAVAILAQYVAHPTKFLYRSVKRVFGYLRSTSRYGLIMQKGKEVAPEYYCDSDYAGERLERKSRTGWTMLINGCAVSWASKKQGCVAMSTAEAEYIALSDCCKEVKWSRMLLGEIGDKVCSPTVIFNDNLAAQSWAEQASSMRKAKHIEVRHHFVRHCVQGEMVHLQHVASSDNVADGFTKPLDRIAFERFRHKIGVRSTK